MCCVTCVDDRSKHHSIEDGPNRNHGIHLLQNLIMSLFMFLQSALPLIPVHPDCGNISILDTVDQFEEEGGGPIRPEVFWAETLGQCIYNNMENQ